MLPLSERNAETAEYALREMALKLVGMDARMDGLHATVCTLMGRMNDLEHMITLRKAAETGHGPTAV